jgi:CheY-like chemotaxis protein
LNSSSAFYVPVVEPVRQTQHRAAVDAVDQHPDKDQTPAGVTDILTIGQEATVFRPIRRALGATGLAVVHTGSLDAALRYLRSNVAAVAITEAEAVNDDWRDVVSRLRMLPDAPEVVVLTSDKLPADELFRLGAFDALRRPLSHADLLWTVATAWHDWMRKRDPKPGGD